METSTYRFDEIDHSLSFAGCSDFLMFDREKRAIFNCDVPLCDWAIKPKIGDIITYHSIGEYGYPRIMVKILVNGVVVYKKPKNKNIP